MALALLWESGLQADAAPQSRASVRFAARISLHMMMQANTIIFSSAISSMAAQRTEFGFAVKTLQAPVCEA